MSFSIQIVTTEQDCSGRLCVRRDEVAREFLYVVGTIAEYERGYGKPAELPR